MVDAQSLKRKNMHGKSDGLYIKSTPTRSDVCSNCNNLVAIAKQRGENIIGIL